jgi:hypothetical protein
MRDAKTVDKDKEVVMYRPKLAAGDGGRTPPIVERRTMTDEEIVKKQERETGDLQTRHEVEKKTLEEQQKAEIDRRPDGLKAEELQRQHETERQVLEEQHRREIEMQRKMHDRERRHGG